MLKYKELKLSDESWIRQRLTEADYKGCEYSFANNYIWRNVYHMEWANVLDTYVTVSYVGQKQKYSYPAGKDVNAQVILQLLEDAELRHINFQMRGILKEQMELLEQWFPGKFSFVLDRSECDYIYLTEKLSTLSGKKLHGKRNHIARFKDNTNWSYEKITDKNLNDCYKMTKLWCKKYGCREHDGLQGEFCAVEEAFENFNSLHLEGGLIRREGNVVAYTIGEPLSSDTYVIHIEKAFHEIQGAYPMINQQFVLHNCQGFQYVNREEDTGEEGLRKAKLSYYPEILLEKYTAFLKSEVH